MLVLLNYYVFKKNSHLKSCANLLNTHAFIIRNQNFEWPVHICLIHLSKFQNSGMNFYQFDVGLPQNYQLFYFIH